MRCGRCYGLMVVDYLMDMEDDSGPLASHSVQHGEGAGMAKGSEPLV